MAPILRMRPSLAPLLRTARPSLVRHNRLASTTPATPTAAKTTAPIPNAGPATPAAPATPEVHGTPVAPTAPASPASPATPLTPEPSVVPEPPVVPNVPVPPRTAVPETPLAPAEPVAPAQPVAPPKPVTPTKPATPSPPPPPPPSSSSRSSGSSNSSGSRFGTYVYATALGATALAAYYYATDTRASFHRYVVPPALRLLLPDAEDAHHYGTATLKLLHRLGLHPRDRTDTPANANAIQVSVFNGEHRLSNPVGVSAGLDKNADIPDVLFDLGAAVVEVGGCTPRPQAGNAKPRVFRVPSVEGMVNRYGLNSIGADAMASRLRTRLRTFARAHGLREEDILSGAAGVPVGSLRPGRLLAVQVAKNKDTDEHDVAAVAEDYAYCVRRLAPYADVLVVNVSSPNTPGLRELQAVEPLTRILEAVVHAAQATADPASKSSAAVEAGLTTLRARAPRVMVKVSPDEDADEQIEGICEAVWASGVDGIIVGNTTKRRTGIVPGKLALTQAEQRNLAETGGFSGPCMYGRTLDLVTRYRKKLDAQALTLAQNGTHAAPKTLMASGGVTTGAQALGLLNAGASVAFMYTGIVYGGAGTVTRVKQELREQVGA